MGCVPNSLSKATPSGRIPEPASSTIISPSARTSTQVVLPPKRRVPEPGTAMEPRVPQNLIRAGDARTLGMEAGTPVVKKAVAVRKHLETNRKDKDSKFRLILIESRIHSKQGPVDLATASGVRVTQEFVQNNQPLFVAVSMALLNGVLDSPGCVDNDIQDCLDSGITNRKTRESGLFYDGKPDNRIYLGCAAVSGNGAWMEGAVAAGWKQVKQLHERVMSGRQTA